MWSVILQHRTYFDLIARGIRKLFVSVAVSSNRRQTSLEINTIGLSFQHLKNQDLFLHALDSSWASLWNFLKAPWKAPTPLLNNVNRNYTYNFLQSSY